MIGPNDPEAGNFRLNKIKNDIYEIRSASTNLCFDIEQYGKDNGAALIQWTCNNGDNQRVRQIDRGNGKKSYQFVHSGRCLDLKDGNPENGGLFQQWDCQPGNPNQEFSLR